MTDFWSRVKYFALKGRAAVYKLKAKTIVVAKDVTVAEDGVGENKNNNGNDNNNNDKGKDKNTNNDNDDASDLKNLKKRGRKNWMECE